MLFYVAQASSNVLVVPSRDHHQPTMAPRCSEVNIHPTTMSTPGRHASHDNGFYGDPARLRTVSHSATTTPHYSTSPLPAAVEPSTVGHSTGTTCSLANLHSTARGRCITKVAHSVAISRKTCQGRTVSFSTMSATPQAPMWVLLSSCSSFLSPLSPFLPSSLCSPFGSEFLIFFPIHDPNEEDDE